MVIHSEHGGFPFITCSLAQNLGYQVLLYIVSTDDQRLFGMAYCMICLKFVPLCPRETQILPNYFKDGLQWDWPRRFLEELAQGDIPPLLFAMAIVRVGLGILHWAVSKDEMECPPLPTRFISCLRCPQMAWIILEGVGPVPLLGTTVRTLSIQMACPL
jgi:hypothetical protein